MVGRCPEMCVMTVSSDEFLRRFLIHVLPKGLVRIRLFGLFANPRRGRMLVRCRARLGTEGCATHPEITTQLRCPVCTAPMIILERLTNSQLHFCSGLLLPNLPPNVVDSSWDNYGATCFDDRRSQVCSNAPCPRVLNRPFCPQIRTPLL